MITASDVLLSFPMLDLAVDFIMWIVDANIRLPHFNKPASPIILKKLNATVSFNQEISLDHPLQNRSPVLKF